MKEIKLGYHYKARPYFTALKESIGGTANSGKGIRTITGKCAYIHPKERFVTLEFPVRGGRAP